jgi:hypothetical protein
MAESNHGSADVEPELGPNLLRRGTGGVPIPGHDIAPRVVTESAPEVDAVAERAVISLLDPVGLAGGER